MQSTSLYHDQYWSDDDEDSINNDTETDLLTSPGYISLQKMPMQTLPQPAWVAEEKLQRSGSYANAPRYYNNFNLKKNKHTQSKRRTKMNNKEYISLFPKIDHLIWYLPTYILRNRSNKCKHYTLLSICIIFIIWTIFAQCITVGTVYFDNKQSTFNVTRGIFYLILYLNPYIASCLRFYFFYYKFDWNLWHKKKEENNSNSPSSPISPISPTLSESYILKEDKTYKTGLRKSLRIGAFILIFTILVKYIFAATILWRITLKELDDKQNLDTIGWFLWISFIVIQGIVFILSIIIPDLLMVIVARIYFTECYLFAKIFVNQFNEMEIDDIINSDLCERYNEMNKKINGYCNLFYLWIMDILFQMVMASWHTISTYIHLKTADSEMWIIYNSIEALLYLLMVIFVLWPAMLMTEKINTMKEIINEKLNGILKKRLHFHDDLILSNLMNAIIQKQHEYIDNGLNDEIEMKSMDNIHRKYSKYEEDENISILWKSITSHSKQECALEILNRLKYLIKKNSSCYQLIGVEIDRSSIRDFIIALIVTNILSFMWDSFDQQN